MGLSIKNAETELLARQLAATTGETVTRAVAVAVRERLDRLSHDDHSAAPRRAQRIAEIATDAGRRWVEPYRSGDHGDILYDDHGLPR